MPGMVTGARSLRNGSSLPLHRIVSPTVTAVRGVLQVGIFNQYFRLQVFQAYADL